MELNFIIKSIAILFTIGSKFIYDYIQLKNLKDNIHSLEEKLNNMDHRLNSSISLTERACRLTLEKLYFPEETTD